MGGNAPPNTLVIPMVQTYPITGNSTTHPTMKGMRMRMARLRTNAPVPSFWCSSRAKKPAMKKNSDMRKMCVTNAAS